MIIIIFYLIGVFTSGWVWYQIYSEDNDNSICSSNQQEYSIDIFKLIKFIIFSFISWIGLIIGLIHADIEDIDIKAKIKIKKKS